MTIPITLRRAQFADAQLLFEWQSHPDTRRFFLNSDSPSWDQHQAWLEAVLNNEKQHLLIALVDEKAVGVLRYDVAESQAEISVYLSPDSKGQGLGTAIIKAGSCWLKAHEPELRRVIACVIPENKASIRAFEKSGFLPRHFQYELSLDTF